MVEKEKQLHESYFDSFEDTLPMIIFKNFGDKIMEKEPVCEQQYCVMKTAFDFFLEELGLHPWFVTLLAVQPV